MNTSFTWENLETGERRDFATFDELVAFLVEVADVRVEARVPGAVFPLTREEYEQLAREWVERYRDRTETLYRVSDEFERRRAKPWGRFLLWLLRKTT